MDRTVILAADRHARDQAHLKRLVRERDAIVDYIAANPVDGA